MMQTHGVRCFRRLVEGKQRHGLWVMTSPFAGIFFHGDRREVQRPSWPVSYLESIAKEITADEAREILSNWPEAASDLEEILARHEVVA